MKPRFRWAIAALALSLFSLAPILWQLLTSIKVNADIAAIPTIYWPRQWTVEHYQALWQQTPAFGRYLLNSAVVSAIATLAALLIGTPCAYAIARRRDRSSQVLVGSLLLVTLFPYVLLFQGLLEVVRWLQWGNNYAALVVPYTALNLPLVILLLRSFFEQLPPELEEAAQIDGLSLGQRLWLILVPLTAPALVTAGILAFIFSWNEYVLALSFISQQALKTVPIAVAEIGGISIFDVPYGDIAAATVVATLPLIGLVLVAQRRILEGLTAGAVKG
ncbi:carbohydrate ABC transporter permease [Synechococcus elongatus]|uniref:Permease protein of sugar ABC transporter n=2 Tax=Synechococcus elongatus TaxID=32046 RepID=Q31PP1_SYNE7|nr:carbohydrate ABC transporter permease [Synechococcus elongatus]ABB56978.1 permease protein of sugar ABC transporter [Synechococcus elongatus PCC 7942 = FACHB-805]AJD58498.1 sugar ABC transporter [Synechococcus elongatus UTEX 2973]MBD2587381.1 carbohydrate ABC transporter permease [Synechococcus elongatus FACHB-242]MBD2688840.1 carbohydrate ABC transporter permease [Synechococcus elongatus FACHB-1061]MBD2707911.1 carbohydrate ABC transporter permease [Synechococcus elongatus PCC 7942 = FACHB